MVPEARKIDVKELTKQPYDTLIKALFEGPKSETLENMIPEGTKVNQILLKDQVLWIDFSKEFIQQAKKDAKTQANLVYSIVNTMTQLNEVEAVKFVIEGKEDAVFLDNGISLKEVFVPKDIVI